MRSKQCSMTSSVWEITNTWRNSLVGELAQLAEQQLAALVVLAADDFVEDDEPGLHTTLAGERAREREPQAQRGEILLAAREAAEHRRQAGNASDLRRRVAPAA